MHVIGLCFFLSYGCFGVVFDSTCMLLVLYLLGPKRVGFMDMTIILDAPTIV